MKTHADSSRPKRRPHTAVAEQQPQGGASSAAIGRRQQKQGEQIAQLRLTASGPNRRDLPYTLNPIQGRWVVSKTLGRFDAEEGYVLKEGERWEDEQDRLSSSMETNESSVGSGEETRPTMPIPDSTVIDIGNRHQQQDPLSLPQVSSLIKTTNSAIVNVQRLGEGLGMDSSESVDSPRQQSNTQSIIKRSSLHLGTLDIENGEHQGQDQQQRRGPRRKPLTLARFVSGIGAPLIEIGALLAAAIGTTLDATGKGPAFFTGVAIIIIAGLKAIADDVKKNEDDPRTWGGRVLHTVGALTPSLMTIPIGIAGTKYGTDTMNVPLATWLPFAIGVIAILMVHLVKLIKWISRS